MSFFSKHLKAFAVCATVCLATASTVQAGNKHKGKNFHNNYNDNHYIYGDNGDCLNPNDYFNNNNNDCPPPTNDCDDDYTPPQCDPPPQQECPPPAVPLPAAATSSLLTMGLLVVGGFGRKALKLVRA
ncbi:MAG: hypothetical protein IT447_09580 [Phycisphaerales bacterium]|jgi:hypothetical protein|nr:hypothetical protein [Phycisphaerales bacterium]